MAQLVYERLPNNDMQIVCVFDSCPVIGPSVFCHADEFLSLS